MTDTSLEEQRAPSPPAGEPEFRWPAINRGVPARAPLRWFRAAADDLASVLPIQCTTSPFCEQLNK